MEGQRNLLDMLSDLKGAPLSIVVWFSLNGNRAVSASELAGEDATGFSDKPIKAGLMKLRELGLITEPRRNRYQLTGKEYQLPLYWNEKVEPFGDSPKFIGDSPKFCGVSPDIEERLNRLENAVFGNAECSAVPLLDIPGRDPEDVPGLERSGSFPEKFGVSPDDCGDGALFDIDGQWSEKFEGGEYSGNIPEKFGVSPDGEIREQSGDVTASGDSPKDTGDTPKNNGDSPKVLINNISNTKDKEVSKYVGKDTYLPDIQNTAMSGLTPAVNAECGMRDAELKWNTAMTQIKGSMDRDSYGTMLRDAKVIGYEEGHYTVAVKLQWVRDWVDQRLREQIEKILSVMEGKNSSVSFVVAEANAGCGIRNAEHFIGHTGYHSQMKSKEPEIRLLPESPDNRENVLVEICNDYLRDPSGIDYTVDQMEELVAMHPDPRVLRFALPTLSSFEAAIVWCAFPFPVAKEKLLARYGIDGKDLQDNEAVSLEIIYDVCKELKPEEKKYAIKRILLRSKGNIPM